MTTRVVSPQLQRLGVVAESAVIVLGPVCERAQTRLRQRRLRVRARKLRVRRLGFGQPAGCEQQIRKQDTGFQSRHGFRLDLLELRLRLGAVQPPGIPIATT